MNGGLVKIIAPTGIGKSTLAQLIAERQDKRPLYGPEFTADRINRNATFVVPDSMTSEQRSQLRSQMRQIIGVLAKGKQMKGIENGTE